jgi:hypothetical protein
MFRAMFSSQPATGVLTGTMISNTIAVGVLLIAATYASRRGWFAVVPPRLRPVALGFATSLTIAYVLLGTAQIDQRFIYFQF